MLHLTEDLRKSDILKTTPKYPVLKEVETYQEINYVNCYEFHTTSVQNPFTTMMEDGHYVLFSPSSSYIT